MRAILLAAGYGTRLSPITDKIPKCLVPIKGKPLLEIWLERLVKSEIGPFLINTHYLSDQVVSFIQNSKYCTQVTLVHEQKLLGTAGTLVENVDFFQGKDGLLIHADNYCMADFHAFIKAHNERPGHCLITMMTFRTDNPSSCGIVELDHMGVVSNYHEKSLTTHGDLANGAVYILSPEIIRSLKGLKNIVEFSVDVLPNLIGKIYTYETRELFFDIGTPEVYEKLI